MSTNGSRKNRAVSWSGLLLLGGTLLVPALLWGWGLFSFKAEELSPRSYVGYIEDPSNGLMKTQKDGGRHFELLYEPNSYKALKGSFKEGEIDTASFRELKKGSQGTYFFTLKVQKEKKGSSPQVRVGKRRHQKEEGVDFSREDLYLVPSEGDTLACALFHEELDHGVRRYRVISLGFPYPEERDEASAFQVVLRKESGSLRFRFEGGDLTSVPDLKIQ